MKYAVGLMACIAIAFLWVTSPDQSRMQAQDAELAVRPPVDAKLDGKLDQILDALHNQSIKVDQADELVTGLAVDVLKIDNRLVSLEKSAAEQPTPAMPPACDCDDLEKQHDELEKRVAALEAIRLQLSSVASGGSTGSAVYKSVTSSVSNGYGSVGSSVASTTTRQPVRNAVGAAAVVATAPIRAVANVANNYQPRWQNYDGKSRIQHAVEDHGMDIRGKSESQILAEMDAYHDRYGGGHPVKMSSAYLAVASPVSRVSYSAASSCPGGVCPTGSQVSRSTSSSGWYLGKSLGRRR